MEIKTKSSFGTLSVHRIGPALPPGTPKGINVYISFEEALKLQLGLQQLLMKLNTYNRNTKEGKVACVDLCLFTDVKSLTITEGKLSGKSQPVSAPSASPSIEDRLADYVAEVEAANLEESTKQTYIRHAETFVRWLNGDFVPGSTKGAPAEEAVTPKKKKVVRYRSVIPEELEGASLFFRAKGILAGGIREGSGVIVLAGSQMKLRETPKCRDYIREARAKLVASGAVEVKGEHYIFRERVYFSSLSAAAAAILGRSANGPFRWETEDHERVGKPVARDA